MGSSWAKIGIDNFPEESGDSHIRNHFMIQNILQNFCVKQNEDLNPCGKLPACEKCFPNCCFQGCNFHREHANDGAEDWVRKLAGAPCKTLVCYFHLLEVESLLASLSNCLKNNDY